MIDRPRIEVVRAVVLDKKGHVIIAKRSPDCRVNPNEWEFPGGKVEPERDETHLCTLYREGEEEIGCKISVLSPPVETSRYLIRDGRLAGTLYVGYAALAKIVEGRPIPSQEHTSIAAVPLRQLDTFGLTSSSQQALVGVSGYLFRT